MLFFEILTSKVKPIAVEIFYRPTNATDFLNRFSNDFQQTENKINNIYLLRDFNVNLLQNGKFILKENQSNELKTFIFALVNKYKTFCQTFSLAEAIKENTRITCCASSQLYHIFTNSSKKFLKKG